MPDRFWVEMWTSQSRLSAGHSAAMPWVSRQQWVMQRSAVQPFDDGRSRGKRLVGFALRLHCGLLVWRTARPFDFRIFGGAQRLHNAGVHAGFLRGPSDTCRQD